MYNQDIKVSKTVLKQSLNPTNVRGQNAFVVRVEKYNRA